MYINFVNYKGGINNLIVVSDNKGNYATSQKDVKTAIKNYKRRIKKWQIENRLKQEYAQWI